MAARSVDALRAEGRAAFEQGDAESSRHSFEAALAEGESGELLEGLARALYLEVDYPGSMDAHQRAFAAYKAEGDALSCARVARLLSWQHVNVYGDFAVAGGWLARAEELLVQAGDDGGERGWVELLHATREPHGEGRERRLRTALEVGRRIGDGDLRFAARAQLGEALVMTGSTEDGMALFDESLAAVCAGEVRDLYVIESVFCGMFVTCERLHDLVRAEQWLRAAGDLVRRRNLIAVGPLCRAHYGGLLTAAGRWDEADVELAEAALDAFELRAASRDADAAAALLRSLGAAGRSGPKRHSPLTNREWEVLDLLALGLSNPEIAERLFISPKTAEHHVGRILRKLDLRNRTEAAAYATRAAKQRPGID